MNRIERVKKIVDWQFSKLHTMTDAGYKDSLRIKEVGEWLKVRLQNTERGHRISCITKDEYQVLAQGVMP